MDIEYLLYLQQFRETVGSILTPLMNAVTKLSAGFLPIAMMCMIYWAFDRKAGRKILAGLGGGLFINGFLKLTFCVYRPWIRDTRILPYGDSKTAATGYSFPSGHTTRATAMFGGSGLWFMEKKHSVVAGLLFVLVFLTMFSRNYLGVHTSQDVLVGFISTAVMMYLTGWLELWSEKEKKRDLMILVAGLLICIAAVLYYEYKPYPLDYLPDGSLLVDPAKMRGDAYEGVGFIASFVICRILEKRQLDFDRISQKLRLFISIFALIPLYWWINTGCPYIIEGSVFNMRLSGAYMSVSGVRSSWLILIRKRTFSSYTFCSCSFIIHFILFSLRRSRTKTICTTMPMQAMMQRETNHQLLYQGGSTFNVKRNWGVVSFPSCVLQLTMMG